MPGLGDDPEEDKARAAGQVCVASGGVCSSSPTMASGPLGPEEEEGRERAGKPASSSSPTPSLLGVFGEHGQQRPEG